MILRSSAPRLRGIASLVSLAPKAAQPYLQLARVDRPVGTYLVLLPALSGLALSAPVGCLPDMGLVAIFSAGAFLMRGAGCTVNDMWDRKFDASVERTRQRPLASGAVSLPGAAAFLAGQLALGLGCLLQLNVATGALGVTCLPLVALYPALKRVTHYPQVALGLAMNWGALMGASATLGSASGGLLPTLAALASGSPAAPQPELLPAQLAQALYHTFLATPEALAVLPLYLGCACWTVVYDTLYAHQDREEDRALQLKSTALLLGKEGSRSALMAGTAGAGGLWLLAGHLAGLGLPFALGAGAATAHLAWQVSTAEWDNKHNLAERFLSNSTTGALLLGGVVAGKLAAGLPA
jgi:4-hydroxybenzoate polyprenyltransferase